MIFILKIAIIVLLSVVVISLMKNIVNKIILMLSDIHIRYFGGKKQFIPSLKDIENEDLKKLVNRLKGDSDKKTLTNILEWEDGNIMGWADRIYMFIIFYILIFLSAIILPIDPYIKYVFILLLIFTIFANFALILFYSIILNSLIIGLFYLVYVLRPMDAQNMLPVHSFVLLSISFGASIGLIMYLLLRYQGVKQQIPEFKRRDMFEESLPVNKIINYKLAICRDYAKLTASLLYNCSSSKVYFFTIRSHVATAVIIENEYYILDQKLPVLTKDGWFKRWGVKEANVYASELVRNSNGEITGISFEKVSISDFSVKDGNSISAELTDKVSKLLGIDQSSQKTIPDFDFTLKKYALYCENDDIVKYSLTRAIKNKLENEFCGNIDKISKIKINQCENNKDLNLSVYL